MKKHYDDEIIIKKRRELQKKKFNSIHTGMYVGERFITFKEQSLDETGRKMVLPDILEPMDEKTKKQKYPMEKRPGIIWADADAEVTVTLSVLKQNVDVISLEQLRDNLGISILSICPQYIFMDKGQVTDEVTSFYWADFLAPVSGGMIYNMIYIASGQDGMLLGGFSCPSRLQDDWKPIILKLIPTIREEVKG